MAARAHYSHAEIVDRDNAQMHELLFQKGVNWNDYPPFFKRGTFLRRQAHRARLHRRGDRLACRRTTPRGRTRA